jgi:predicted O-methyltransferase YrrM
LWLNQNLIDFEDFAKNIDQNLWQESVTFSQELEHKSKEILSKLSIGIGGGGIYPLIYFVTRHKKPKITVETGVAAGYSSQTFLSAIDKNGFGKLYSSDFPYFRIDNPEKYIGILVDEKLKSNWNLYIDGDKTNLPKIMSEIDSIDLFHFDSDKSYEGRIFATNLIKNKLSENAIVFYDDINDNTHFYDYVTQNNIKNYKVFKFMGKYIGMIGNF